MTLKAMYNNIIAGNYDAANQFGSISKSHDIAISQIENERLNNSTIHNVTDLGVGDAAFLEKLQNYIPTADFIGIDISDKMLINAKQKLKLKTIEASAASASLHIQHNSQDLVIAHFINAYVPINQLFHEAFVLNKNDKYFSLITTTYESFPVGQQYLTEFIAKNTIFSRIIGHYYQTMTKNTPVASGQEELLSTFEKHHFKILNHQRIHIPITLNNINELAAFGINGTWFLNSLAIRILPKNFLINRLKHVFNKIFKFPYHDTHIIDIILAKKK